VSAIGKDCHRRSSRRHHWSSKQQLEIGCRAVFGLVVKVGRQVARLLVERRREHLEHVVQCLARVHGEIGRRARGHGASELDRVAQLAVHREAIEEGRIASFALELVDRRATKRVFLLDRGLDLGRDCRGERERRDRGRLARLRTPLRCGTHQRQGARATKARAARAALQLGALGGAERAQWLLARAGASCDGCGGSGSQRRGRLKRCAGLGRSDRRRRGRHGSSHHGGGRIEKRDIVSFFGSVVLVVFELHIRIVVRQRHKLSLSQARYLLFQASRSMPNNDDDDDDERW